MSCNKGVVQFECRSTDKEAPQAEQSKAEKVESATEQEDFETERPQDAELAGLTRAGGRRM